ncbi:MULTISPECIES: flavin reductase family protein [Actinomadura]|uniref:Flavin reductase family protein n=1 Tax=Actinomadura yumaensis TaxID=111807 RepID=A0ABW2CLA2_9ACTN|nr:flavin reductase family protein [Actinomadura sp. J1-007]MWK36608.1 flavin reductase [Actinomadura sp. J1-007]
MIMAFKQAASRFASGVTVVTTRVGEEVYGITCSSFASLSLDPLLVTVSVNAHSPLLGRVRASGCFAISVLHREQREISQYFATRDRGGAREAFDGFPTSLHATGAPVMDGCLSYFDCRLHDVLPGGDHRILVGNVVAAGGDLDGGEPLLYYAGGYRSLESPDRGPDRGEA